METEIFKFISSMLDENNATLPLRMLFVLAIVVIWIYFFKKEDAKTESNDILGKFLDSMGVIGKKRKKLSRKIENCSCDLRTWKQAFYRIQFDKNSNVILIKITALDRLILMIFYSALAMIFVGGMCLCIGFILGIEKIDSILYLASHVLIIGISTFIMFCHEATATIAAKKIRMSL